MEGINGVKPEAGCLIAPAMPRAFQVILAPNPRLYSSLETGGRAVEERVVRRGLPRHRDVGDFDDNRGMNKTERDRTYNG